MFGRKRRQRRLDLMVEIEAEIILMRALNEAVEENVSLLPLARTMMWG